MPRVFNENFKNASDEIQKLFKSWLFRHLTPFGRITIIKSMALSKLSHLVLVCPHLGTENLAKLKDMIFKFLWNNKPDRMKREQVMLPVHKGGLNLPDLEKFWASLKLSWARRLQAPACLWQRILELNLLYVNHSMEDVWYSGPLRLTRIVSGGKYLTFLH